MADRRQGANPAAGGAKRGAECGAVRYVEALDAAAENIGGDLQEFTVPRAAASGDDSRRPGRHPLGVEAHRQELAFDHCPAVPGGMFGLVGQSPQPYDAGRRDARHDLGLEPGQHHDPIVPRRRRPQRGVEAWPVESEAVADGLACERAVAETDQAHRMPARRDEHMAVGVRVDGDLFQKPEVRVARAQTEDRFARFTDTDTDEGAGVVARAGDDLGRGRQAVARDEVWGDVPDDRPRRTGRDEPAVETFGRRGHRGLGPFKPPDVEQVHARTIAVVDRGDAAGQYRRDEGTDQADMSRIGPCFRVGPGEAADLGTGEALEGVAAGQLRCRCGAAECVPDLCAFLCG